MTDRLQAFIRATTSTSFDSRSVVVDRNTKLARLGNLIFSEKNEVHQRTMAAFKEALVQKHGIFGSQAFEAVLKDRVKNIKSLRVCDIRNTLFTMSCMRFNQFKNELNRQLDNNPLYRCLDSDSRRLVRNQLNTTSPQQCLKQLSRVTTQAELNRFAQDFIKKAVDTVEQKNHVSFDQNNLGQVTQGEAEIAATTPTGLIGIRNTSLSQHSTSVEDRIKRGELKPGERINNYSNNPMIFAKLKTNGVEPGFIFHRDWSQKDSKSLLMDFNSEQSRQILENLKNQNQPLSDKCRGKEFREQIMLCGHSHPAIMSAVADYMLEQSMQQPDSAIYKAFCTSFPDTAPQDYRQIEVKELKTKLFIEIRDTVLSQKEDSPHYEKSPVFQHFQDKHIVKLDYNENDRLFIKKAANAGLFMRPERTKARKFGTVYRLATASSASSISVGAATEALANDLGRICGVPSQDLRIVRGKYSNGFPKLMLEAKFSEGYKDIGNGLLKDGRVVPPAGENVESIGKYKAFFLVMADRDAVGSRGQNKGFAKGSFFAIDPGHSLEDNGKYLEIHDNLSFKDTHGFSFTSRFANYSVFDDDTRFEKFKGVLKLREMKEQGKLDDLFNSYKAAFDPNDNKLRDDHPNNRDLTQAERDILSSEKHLREKINASIDTKRQEFNTSLTKLLNVMQGQLDLYDALSPQGEEIQQGAIETIENLEKICSPTTWLSEKNEVPLKHLQVIESQRIPWNARVKGDSIVYRSAKPLTSFNARARLSKFLQDSNAELTLLRDGSVQVKVKINQAQETFLKLTEDRVAMLTHPAEAQARLRGGNGLTEGKFYNEAMFS